jgi:hypothetical protein
MKPPLKIRAGRYVLEVPVVDGTLRGNQDFRDVWISRAWGLYPGEGSKLQSLDASIQSSKRWDNIMARKTYRIELKMDFDEDARHDILTNLIKQYARDILGSAMLLQDGRKPAVAFFTDDTFTGMEELEILDPSENLHEPDNTSSNV